MSRKKNKIHTIIYSAFCGTGKSYLCKKYPDRYKELECWNYEYKKDGKFPANYIDDIKKQIGNVQYLFISTNPVVLKQLHKEGIEIVLVYPDKSLKEEYMKRYCTRNDAYDFIGVMYKHWDDWLTELKEQNCCKRIILKSGQYLQDVL